MTHLHSSRDTIDNARTVGPGLNHSGSTPHRPRLQTEHDVRAGEVMPWRVGQRARRHEEVLHRSEEHTSELQSLMRISYAVFCLKKKKDNNDHRTYIENTQTIYEYSMTHIY